MDKTADTYPRQSAALNEGKTPQQQGQTEVPITTNNQGQDCFVPETTPPNPALNTLTGNSENNTPTEAAQDTWTKVTEKKNQRKAFSQKTTINPSPKRFEALELIELEPFSDEDFTPMAVVYGTGATTATFKYKKGAKARTTSLNVNIQTKQDIKHPKKDLDTTNPG